MPLQMLNALAVFTDSAAMISALLREPGSDFMSGATSLLAFQLREHEAFGTLDLRKTKAHRSAREAAEQDDLVNWAGNKRADEFADLAAEAQLPHPTLCLEFAGRRKVATAALRATVSALMKFDDFVKISRAARAGSGRLRTQGPTASVLSLGPLCLDLCGLHVFYSKGPLLCHS